MTQRWISLVLSLFCVVFLVGCNEEAKIQKATPKATDAFVREFITALQKKDAVRAEKMIQPKIRAEAKPKIKSLFELFSAGTPKQVKALGVRIKQSPEQKLVQLNYQIYFEKVWILASVLVLETAQERFILSVRMDPLKQPLEKIYAFQLSGKTWFHYLVLFFSIFMPIFIGYVLMQCFRMQVKWKWLWIPFILLGLTRLQLDWTSGHAFFQPVRVLIFGANFFKQTFSPLMLSVGIPVGALIFFFKYIFKFQKKSALASL